MKTGWRPGRPVRIDCGRYFLRSLGPENFPPILESWFSDKELLAHVHIPINLNMDKIGESFANYDNKSNFALGIWTKKPFEIIGFYRIYVDRYHLCATTSVVVGDRDHWGEGVVLESRRKLLDFLFFQLRLNKVCGEVHARNAAAIFNYRKMKFTKEGVRRKQFRDRRGHWGDVVLFGMLRDEWIEIRKETDADP